jgi:hypothetical protein
MRKWKDSGEISTSLIKSDFGVLCTLDGAVLAYYHDELDDEANERIGNG